VPFAYYIMMFCAHVFHMRQRGILQENEWVGWLQWMRNAFRYGSLSKAWKEIGMESRFDPAFLQFVKIELLSPKPPA